MPHRSWPFRALICLAFAGGVIPRSAQADAGDGASIRALTGGVTVSVPLLGLRSVHGLIQACMTTRPNAFPDCDKDPTSLRLTMPVAPHGQTVLVFRHVMPGTYGISLFHDENCNGRMDKMMGIPSEGYGFSRDAAVRFGPPHFSEAQFAVSAVDLSMPIKVRYIL